MHLRKFRNFKEQNRHQNELQEAKSNFEHEVQKSMSSVLANFEHHRSWTRLSSLHESCSSSSLLSREFWITSFRHPSEELWPKYDDCAILKKSWRANTGILQQVFGNFLHENCSWNYHYKHTQYCMWGTRHNGKSKWLHFSMFCGIMEHFSMFCGIVEHFSMFYGIMEHSMVLCLVKLGYIRRKNSATLRIILSFYQFIIFYIFHHSLNLHFHKHIYMRNQAS